jgi:protein-disulfide isomerase
MNRRRFLGLAALTALAGCSGSGQSDGSDGSGSGGDSGGTDGGDGSGSDGGGGATHDALTAIDSQPHLGPAPGEATGTIVAFEDPSCSRCAAFEQNIVPKIRSNLVESGKATFVFRGYPVIYAWGDPATHALEATYARDESAFWTLVSHYFENQGDFRRTTTDEVFAKTESFLASETSVDAEAVVTAAESDAAGAAVQTDLDAGKAAGAGRTTPHVFLFRDGQYRTKAAGSVSYETIEAVLQV